MLAGVAVDDFVGVRFTKAGEGFALDAIRKFEGPRQGRPEGAPGERRMRKGEGAKDKPACEAKCMRKPDGKGKGEMKADCDDGPNAKAKGEANVNAGGEKKGDCCKGCPKDKAKDKAAEKANAVEKDEDPLKAE